MHVVQTAADPPNQGRINFEASGCTRNNRQALASIVLPKKTGTGTVARLASAALVDLLSVAKLDTRKKRLLAKARFAQALPHGIRSPIVFRHGNHLDVYQPNALSPVLISNVN
jgi:hypothetical protein